MSRAGAPLDTLLARFLDGLASGDPALFDPAAAGRPPADPLFYRTVAALVAALRDGHVCLDLARAPQPPEPADGEAGETGEAPPPFPAPAAWREAMAGHPLVGAPGEETPLVLDGAGRLYLHRYWRAERELAADLRRRLARLDDPGDTPDFATLFRALADGADPDQRLALLAAALHGASVVSGGPGTGKTTTAARIVALHAATLPAGRLPVVRLCAPTGKAAARLAESFGAALAGLTPALERLRPGLAARLPREAATIHRLLGPVADSGRFRHHEGHPLAADLVLVDEASMVPLTLMRRLAGALAPGCRLVLLGDMDQLASVEAGRVLGDLCAPERPVVRSRAWVDRAVRLLPGAFAGEAVADGFRPHDAIVRLRTNHRSVKGIAEIAGALNACATRAEAEALLARLRGDGPVRFRPLPPRARFAGALEAALAGPLDALFAAGDPAAALAAHAGFRILAARRAGRQGVGALNALAERALERAGRIDRRRAWYDHRPVMVTANDYVLDLYNGDVGLFLDGRVRFPAPALPGGVRDVPPALVPACETAYATTIHKSQGSEYDAALVILPDRPVPRLVTKELLYTAITRAKREVEVWGPPSLFLDAAVTRIERSSGLRDALWAGEGHPDGNG